MIMKLSNLPLKVVADLQGTDEITLTDRDAGGTVIETGRVTLSELGASGLLGADGADGIQGIQGIPGNDGADSTVAGPQGIQGNDGADGSDATATATIAVADGSAMQVIIDAGSVEVGQLFSLVSDRSIRRFEGGNASSVVNNVPQANPAGYATMVSVKSSTGTTQTKHDGTDSATGICYSVDGGTPVYKSSAAAQVNNLSIPHKNGTPINISIWPTDYVGSDGAVTSVAPRAGNLTFLGLTNQGITSLNVSSLSALTHISVPTNLLTTLDVSGLTALSTLYCAGNLLTSMDVSGLASFTGGNFNENPMVNVNLSGTTLGSSGVWLNHMPLLTSLDLSGQTSLTQLSVSDNPSLTSIIATGVSLAYIFLDESRIQNNNLSEAALIAFVGSLATTTTGQIYYGGNPGSAAFETWLIANPTLDKGYVWVNN